MIKKLAAVMLAAVMLCGTAVPVSAAEAPAAGTDNVNASEVSVTETAADTQASLPFAERSAVTSVTMKKSKAILTWQPVTGAAGYEIYQKSSGSDWTYAAEVSSDTLGYTASGLSVYKKYSFKVRAYAGSSTSSKTTASSSSAAASAAAADNNYSDFSDVVSGYVITDSWSYGKLAWPIPARHHVSSYFGRRTAPTYGASTYHEGIDIGISSGTRVICAADGVVAAVGSSGARGRYVLVRHANGLTTRYQHLSKSLVKRGQRVLRGQTIARSGNTGISTGPHLHFEVLKNGRAVNPLKYFSR